MKRSIYLQPTAIFWDRSERRAIEEADIPAGKGLPLAGGRLSFAALDVLTRATPATKRRTIVLGDAFSGDWGREALAAADILQELSGERARFAGLSLDRPRIMGIINVTPDSFSDGGHYASHRSRNCARSGARRGRRRYSRYRRRKHEADCGLRAGR